jgi:hypothetical protein
MQTMHGLLRPLSQEYRHDIGGGIDALTNQNIILNGRAA